MNSTVPVPLFNVTPVQLMAVLEALLVMFNQVSPPSTEPNKMSPALKAPDKVAVMVCDAVLVTRSELLVPVSLLMAVALTLSVGACVSSV